MSRSVGSLLLAIPLLHATPSSAQSLAFQDVFVDFPGAQTTEVNGMNDAGHLVGVFSDGSTEHGFLLANGSFTQLDVDLAAFPGASFTEAMGINNLGQIVGGFEDADDPNGADHAFLLSGGSYTLIDCSQGNDEWAGDTNDSGAIIGAVTVSGQDRAFLLLPGDPNCIVLDCPEGQITDADGINNAGVITGDFEVAGERRGFLMKDHTSPSCTQLPGPGVREPGHVNDANEIAGTLVADPNDELGQGFLLSNGVYTSIDFPGAALTGATAINDLGQIAGSYSNDANDPDARRGFVATPSVPTHLSAGSLLIPALLVFAALALATRRRASA